MRLGLTPVVVLVIGIAMITGTMAIVAVSSESAFDVSGRATESTLDQAAAGDRPEPSDGVRLKPPAVETDPEADTAPLKAEKVCGKATEADEQLGIEKGTKLCRWSGTRQPPDLARAPRFRLTEGAKRAPEPSVEPEAKPTDEPADQAGSSEDPSATPASAPSEFPAIPDPTSGRRQIRPIRHRTERTARRQSRTSARLSRPHSTGRHRSGLRSLRWYSPPATRTTFRRTGARRRRRPSPMGF